MCRPDDQGFPFQGQNGRTFHLIQGERSRARDRYQTRLLEHDYRAMSASLGKLRRRAQMLERQMERVAEARFAAAWTLEARAQAIAEALCGLYPEASTQSVEHSVECAIHAIRNA